MTQKHITKSRDTILLTYFKSQNCVSALTKIFKKNSFPEVGTCFASTCWYMFVLSRQITLNILSDSAIFKILEHNFFLKTFETPFLRREHAWPQHVGTCLLYRQINKITFVFFSPKTNEKTFIVFFYSKYLSNICFQSLRQKGNKLTLPEQKLNASRAKIKRFQSKN
jgi:hypothetical protein